VNQVIQIFLYAVNLWRKYNQRKFMF